MVCQLNIINEKKYPLTRNLKVKLVEIIKLIEENINLSNNKLLKIKSKQKK